MSTATNEYQKGYSAAKKSGDSKIKLLESEIERIQENINRRDERIFMQCLEMTLKNCTNWEIGGNKVNNAESYCRLAKVFADNSINKLKVTHDIN